MSETRELRLEHKHITFNHVVKLAKSIDKIHQDRLKKEHHSEIKYIITCFNDSEAVSKDISIFNKNSSINSRLIQSIAISYRSFDNNEKIDVVIFHGNNVFRNIANVSSPDSVWVNNTTQMIESALHSEHAISHLITDYQKILLYATALSFGMFVIMATELAIRTLPVQNFIEVPLWFGEPYYSLSPLLYWPLMYIIALFIGKSFATNITSKLLSLYPLVNLQTGAENTAMETERQKVMVKAFSVWLLPLIMAVASFVIGK